MVTCHNYHLISFMCQRKYNYCILYHTFFVLVGCILGSSAIFQFCTFSLPPQPFLRRCCSSRSLFALLSGFRVYLCPFTVSLWLWGSFTVLWFIISSKLFHFDYIGLEMKGQASLINI